MAAAARAAILIYTLRVAQNGECIQIRENVQNGLGTNLNSTTLYPVDKNIFLKSTTEQTVINKKAENNLNADVTVWKVNTTYANFRDVKIENGAENINNSVNTNKTLQDCKELRKLEKEKDFHPNAHAFPNNNMGTDVNKLKNANNDAKANMNAAKDNEKGTVYKKEFKPSPHLSSYYDTLDDSPLHFATSAPPIKPYTFFGSSRDNFEQHPVMPPEGFVAFPYEHENIALTHPTAEWTASRLQSRPTVEAPARTPAGGLYRRPDVLKDYPNLYADNDDYNQGHIDDVKEYPVKKRADPWRKLLHLVTALLPVGLIVSALTPSVITLHGQQPGPPQHRSPSRSVDDPAAFPAISEECKRRLLCEIHSDRNYQSDGSPRGRKKRCHKIHCEEPQSVSRALSWLLAHHRGGHARSGGYA